MGSSRQEVEAFLQEVRSVTATDFAALALVEEDEGAIRWRYASGNRNERYQRIVLRLGKGVAGKVMRSGRPMILESFAPKSGDDPREFPIMLAEGLRAMVGVPVVVGLRVLGVLMIGCRVERTFSEETVSWLQEQAVQVGSILMNRGAHPHEPFRPIAFPCDLGSNTSL